MQKLTIVDNQTAYDHLRWQWLIDVCRKEYNNAYHASRRTLRAVHTADAHVRDVRNENRTEFKLYYVALLSAADKQFKIWQRQGNETPVHSTWEDFFGVNNLDQLQRLYNNDAALQEVARSIRGRVARPPIVLVRRHEPAFAACPVRLRTTGVK